MLWLIKRTRTYEHNTSENVAIRFFEALYDTKEYLVRLERAGKDDDTLRQCYWNILKHYEGIYPFTTHRHRHLREGLLQPRHQTGSGARTYGLETPYQRI